MKFTKGQTVTVPCLDNAKGEVVHAFVTKVYARVDVNHYNVLVGKQVYELAEDELT